jgi:hypothetical protein
MVAARSLFLLNGKLGFLNTKPIVGYYKGFWYEQTLGMFIRAKYSIVSIGPPQEKLKYYRGGMQA